MTCRLPVILILLVGTICNSRAVEVSQTNSYAPATILSSPIELIQPFGQFSFGFDVAIDNDLAVVTAPFHPHPGSNSQSGAAYLFDAMTGQYLRPITISEPPSSRGFFGTSAAIANDLVVVGDRADDAAGNSSGSAYVFQAETGGLLHTLAPTNHRRQRQFGYDVAVADSRVLVGTQNFFDAADKTAFLFDATTGQQLMEFRPESASPSGIQFGYRVALVNELAVVSAISDSTSWDNSGAVYFFDAASGEQVARLLPPEMNSAITGFGMSIAADGNLLLVAALERYDADRAVTHAYLYDLETGQYVNSFQAETSSIGFAPATPSIAIGSGYVYIGTGYDGEFGYTSGSVTIFDIDGDSQPMRLYAPTGPSIGAGFGASIALDGNTLVVGQYLHNEDTSQFGAAYIYRVIPEPGTIVISLGLASGALLMWRGGRNFL